jgi:hypothetical protein
VCYSQSQGDSTYIGGGLFLLVFISIGAFVFANLVVAVVVTNLVRTIRISTVHVHMHLFQKKVVIAIGPRA